MRGLHENRRKAIGERRKLRTEAEHELARHPVAAVPMPADKLLHELQVHQIELEMQNDELRRSQVALEEARDRYLNLFEFAPVGYVTLTDAGLIDEVNFSAAALLGVERKKLLKVPFSRYIDAAFVDQFHLSMSRLCGPDEPRSYELLLKCGDDALRHVHVAALRVVGEDGKHVLRMTLTDITAQKQAEQSLRIAAIAFEGLAGLVVFDSERNIMRVNQAFTRLTAYSEQDMVGQPSSMLRSAGQDGELRLAAWASLERNGHWQGEIWLQQKGGGSLPVLAAFAAVMGEGGRVTNYVGSFLDISAQKQAEKTLQDARTQLEREVKKTVGELAQIKEESSEVSTALKVMLKLRDSDSEDAKNLLILELKQEVLPFLQRLKAGSHDRRQIRLLNTLDANLQRLISSYGGTAGLSSIYKSLTPQQIQVASMVREGFSTKAIAATLSLSPETISIHRKNIRKKLGLESKSDNLRSYLVTLGE